MTRSGGGEGLHSWRRGLVSPARTLSGTARLPRADLGLGSGHSPPPQRTPGLRRSFFPPVRLPGGRAEAAPSQRSPQRLFLPFPWPGRRSRSRRLWPSRPFLRPGSPAGARLSPASRRRGEGLGASRPPGRVSRALLGAALWPLCFLTRAATSAVPAAVPRAPGPARRAPAVLRAAAAAKLKALLCGCEVLLLGRWERQPRDISCRRALGRYSREPHRRWQGRGAEQPLPVIAGGSPRSQDCVVPGAGANRNIVRSGWWERARESAFTVP